MGKPWYARGDEIEYLDALVWLRRREILCGAIQRAVFGSDLRRAATRRDTCQGASPVNFPTAQALLRTWDREIAFPIASSLLELWERPWSYKALRFATFRLHNALRHNLNVLEGEPCSK